MTKEPKSLETKLREILDLCDGDIEMAKELRREQREAEWEEMEKEIAKKTRGES